MPTQTINFDALQQDDVAQENQEWTDALHDILRFQGDERGRDILRLLQNYLLSNNINLTEATLNTPYRNTISIKHQPSYPSQPELEQQLENVIRWNALALVLHDERAALPDRGQFVPLNGGIAIPVRLSGKR